MGGGGVKARAANPRGYPDFTLPVSIIAQLVEKLKVDIIAQTLATLKVDIAAQTLAQVDVNIAAQAVTLSVSVVGTANVYITDATVYLTQTVGLEKATVRRASAQVIGAEAVLYTTPAGKRAQLVAVMLCAAHYDAGPHIGTAFLWDGTAEYKLIWIHVPDAVDGISESLSGGIVSIPVGWELRVKANPSARASACAVIIEY